MTKSKSNAFADLMLDEPAHTPAEKPVPAEKPPVKQGRGRPKKVTKGEVQVTTVRLDADDHLAVRTLALRDSMTMNELIQAALRDYCHKRGVRLS
jgi:hypothetical protein